MFLSSTIDKSIQLLIKKTRKRRVLFITNPSDPFKKKYWMKNEIRAFENNGFNVQLCDIRKDTPLLISEFGIVHICGGSALYILDLLKRTRWYSVLKSAIRKERVIYTGSSAGSMIMAPSIWFAHDDEDETEAGMTKIITDYSAFGFIPFYIMCHSQDKYYIPSTKKSIDRLPYNKLPILFLNDGMALWVENNKIEFLNS